MIVIVRTASLPASPAFLAKWDGEAFIPITKPAPYRDIKRLHQYVCMTPEELHTGEFFREMKRLWDSVVLPAVKLPKDAAKQKSVVISALVPGTVTVSLK